MQSTVCTWLLHGKKGGVITKCVGGPCEQVSALQAQIDELRNNSDKAGESIHPSTSSQDLLLQGWETYPLSFSLFLPFAHCLSPLFFFILVGFSLFSAAEKLHEERKRGALLEERVREVEASLNSKDYEIQEKELEVEQLRYTSWSTPKYGKVVSLHREEDGEARRERGWMHMTFVWALETY